MDWTSILNNFIAVLPATLIAIGGIVMSWRNGKKVEEVHKATNGMTDKLISLTRSNALQEGHTAGVKDEKEKQGEVKS